MSAVKQFEDEQTLTFRAPAGWGQQAAPPEDALHLLLLLREGDAMPRRIPLRSLPITIGRSAPAELVLEGGTVSRRHCRLELCNDQLLLTDLGSTNGTFVDG